jgi:hydrogenase expression/formation protein HypE
MKLPPGKIPPNLLREIVFRNLGSKRSEVILGPAAGIDGAVIKAGNQSIIVSMDPITGALEKIGWLAVNVNANDVATFGVKPRFLSSCILLPENAEKDMVERICVQMNRAARELEISITGGHCEVVQRLTSPIVVGCMMGITEEGNYVTAKGSRPGDRLILTKSAGIEGTAILASDKKKQLRKVLDAETLKKARQFYRRISIVKDALVAFESGGVHAMHDPTEGGIAGAVHEMADASGLGVKLFSEKIAVEPETAQICRFFRLDPLRLIASGSLLIAAEQESTEIILEALSKNDVSAECVGRFLRSPEKRVIVDGRGQSHRLVRPQTDDLWRALESSLDPLPTQKKVHW